MQDSSFLFAINSEDIGFFLIKKLQIRRICSTNNDGSQNTFLYQATLHTLQLKGTDYIVSWKSKRAFNSKLKPLYTASLHSIKLSG